MVWEAPHTSTPEGQPLTVTLTAVDQSDSDHGGAAAVDPSPGDYFHCHFYVHKLQVQRLWMGLPMYEEQAHPSAPYAPHCYYEDEQHLEGMVPVECDLWDNSTMPISDLKYSTYYLDEDDGRILLAGGEVGTSRATYEADPQVNYYCGGLLPSICFFRHTIPDDTAEFLTDWVEVAHLPTEQYVHASSAALNREISFTTDVAWEWKCEISDDVMYASTVGVIAPQIDGWIASSYGYPILDDTWSTSECTPQRVQDVYTTLRGKGTESLVAEAASSYAAAKLPFSGYCWTHHPGGAVWDVWCAICIGQGGDCITEAQLAAEACKVVGLDATAYRAWPHKEWLPEYDYPSWWEAPQPCFAPDRDWWFTGAGCPGRSLGYPGNAFEGYFEAAGRYWTCTPHDTYDHVGEIIDRVAPYFNCYEGGYDDLEWVQDPLDLSWHQHLIPKPPNPYQ